ncbi:BTAD domain-containing putative transcriptional regulator [Arenimonas sp.]|uniref:BTAD domain-containing putative transcriptional regulator n=1 Tax=Arenimonas sp. TaxID=1872635 RepID=UPI0039E4C2FD
MAQLAKLTRPKLHQVLPRERLFERLDACRERPMTWVTGPPGAGKSALVASYVEGRRLGGIWYQVDPGDRNLETFFHYLSRAALDGSRKKKLVLPQFGAEHRADLSGFARLYFRALFESLKAPAIVVLDNYHELPAGSELHGLLDIIAREIPEGFAIVATSRSDPPDECATLRALDRLAVVDWDDLRLTLDETRRIAALRHVVDETLVQGMHEHAGGWPVGLTLSLEQVKRGVGGPASQESQSREVLFNYFAGQIVASLPAAGREQLMRVALLPRATAAQASAIAGDAGVASLLESLYRKRLFVERRGDSFQFHDLFRAFLLDELERTHAMDEANRLRIAAAGLLAEADQVEAAFVLATQARDWTFAASLMLRFAPRLFEMGRAPVLRDWFAALPAPMVDASPWLTLWQGVSLSPVAPLQARERFEAAFSRFPPEEKIGRILASGAILMTHYLEFDHGAVDRWLDELLPLLADPPVFPAVAAELRTLSALSFALSYQRPRSELTEPCLARIRTLLSSAELPINARVEAATLLLAHYQIAADFEEASRIIAMAAAWTADPQLTPTYRALWTLQLGHCRVKQGLYDEAMRTYELAEAIARDNALVLMPLRVYVHIGRATVALCLGDADVAEAERQRAASHWTFARRLDRALDAGLRASIASHRGETAEAIACGSEQLQRLDECGPVWLRCFARLQQALILVDAGDESDAEVHGLVAQARALLEGTCLSRLAVAADCVEAYASLRKHEPVQVRELLERCVAGAQSHQGLYYLRMHPQALSTVFGAALACGIETDYVRRVIREMGLRAPASPPDAWPWPYEIRMLGRFEVLREGRPLEFSRKLPRKTLALLKAIVALGAGSVSEQRLIDTLWPDEEGDAAARALDATVLRLRSLLGDASVVNQRGGSISLDLDRVWVDVAAFEQFLAAAQSASHRRAPSEMHHLDRALGLYQGAFLTEDEGEGWPVAVRERLRGRFIHALGQYAERLEAAGEEEAAIRAYLRGIDADAAVESFYQGLMRCYQRMDRRSEGIAAYQRLKQILSITLGLAPSAASERLYQALRQQ